MNGVNALSIVIAVWVIVGMLYTVMEQLNTIITLLQ